MLKVYDDSFGKINKFNVGDIVSWSNIGVKSTGVISDIYFSMVGGRNVAFAKIYGFKDKVEHVVICLNLILVSKSNSKAEEN
ncbi:MAG TPA: hypothetical protein DCX27_01655 [Balneola sp.]|jgi:hypothetical protein|nr:hypothetical protein [Balneola sp.]|tara:strand:- start:238 stop:483 length:246 start_codon:yes stop_codon:yes gene_type:complete